jgi:hypothetical protein
VFNIIRMAEVAEAGSGGCGAEDASGLANNILMPTCHPITSVGDEVALQLPNLALVTAACMYDGRWTNRNRRKVTREKE